MPDQIVAEPGQTNIGDVFPTPTGNDLPGILEPLEREETAEPEPTPKPPVKAPEKPASVPEPSEGVKIPDSVFDEPQKPTEPVKDEPEKSPAPEDLSAWYEKHGIKGEKARENFEKLTETARKNEEKATKLETALSEERKQREAGDPAATARIQQLEGQLKQLQPVVERANLEARPDFQQRFIQPREKAMELARETLKDSGLDPLGLEKALALTGAAKVSALDDIYEAITSPSQREGLSQAVNFIKALDRDREKVLQDAAGWNQKLALQDQAARHQAFQQHKERETKGMEETEIFLRDEVKLEVLRDSESPEWNEVVKNVKTTAKRLMLETEDPAELRAAAYLAAACPVYRNIVHSQRDTIKTLESRLKEYEDSEPSLGGKGKKEKRSSAETDLGIELSEDDPDIVRDVLKSLKVGRLK